MFKMQLLESMKGTSKEILSQLQTALDKVSMNYNIEPKENSLLVYDSSEQPLVKLWVASKRVEGMSEETLSGYTLIVSNFFKQVGKSPSEVNAFDIRMWMSRYREINNISNATMEQYRQYVCRFFKWAFEEGMIQSNPASHIGKIKCESKQRQALSQFELEKVRRCCKNSRDLAIVDTMYSTGCRASELCNLKKSDINWLTKEVTLFGKGKKYRTSFLNAKAYISLQEYLNSRTDNSEYLFVGLRNPHDKLQRCAVEKMFRVLHIESGIEKPLSPHVIRHTTATQMLVNSDIATVSKLLGHSSVATTAIYTHINNRDIQLAHERSII